MNIDLLNNAARALAPELGLRLIDQAAMVDSLTPLLGTETSDGRFARLLGADTSPKKEGTIVAPTTDGRHLHAYLDIEVANLILAELAVAHRERPTERRWPRCGKVLPSSQWRPAAGETGLPEPTKPGERCAKGGAAEHAPDSPALLRAVYAPLPTDEQAPDPRCARYSWCSRAWGSKGPSSR